jgi:SNF2 family DNA or RNA helicase
MLTGATTNREKVVKQFQEDPACQFFLISLKAGGTGLNLTEAGYVMLLDPWWNPAAEMQAINRAHRIGQDKKVIAYKFITSGTIEEKMLVLQQRKQTLSDTFLPSGNPLKDMSLEEMEELFG